MKEQLACQEDMWLQSSLKQECQECHGMGAERTHGNPEGVCPRCHDTGIEPAPDMGPLPEMEDE